MTTETFKAVPVIHVENDEIPCHIINTVDSTAAKREAQLAKGSKRPRLEKRTERHRIMPGLLVDHAGSETRLTGAEVTEGADADLDALLHRRRSGDGVDTSKEDDKENQFQVAGKELFSFHHATQKSFKTILGSLQAIREEAIAKVDQSRGKRTRDTVRKSQRRATKRAEERRKEQEQDEGQARRLGRRNVQQAHDDASDMSESSEEASEGTGESDDEEVDANTFSSITRKGAGQSTSLVEEDAVGYERYFTDLHGGGKTSDHTLSKLPRLEPKELKDLMSRAKPKHVEEKKLLYDIHRHAFPQWLFEMSCGFNLVFYGYGSKRKLLSEFVKEYLNDNPVLVVNGYFPSITIKDILNHITVGVLEDTTTIGSIQEHAAYIDRYFRSPKRKYDRIYLLIHSIDGTNLRNDKTQTILSMLAANPNIHLVASVDHINAGVLWDNVKARRFNFCWHDATTYEPYTVETSFENSIMVNRGDMQTRGVKYVLQSLTANARDIFRILAEHQITECEVNNITTKATEEQGLSYQTFFNKCREQFLVSTDVSFRAQLTEYRDHQIIHSKKQPDGTEILYIPMDAATLAPLLEDEVEV